MAKADLLLPDGTRVTIDGSADEITKILSAYATHQSEEPPSVAAKRTRRRATKSKAPRAAKSAVASTGPTSQILELRDEGFFKASKRSLNQIQKALEERGHIYARTTLSPTLIKLVRRRDIRRVKDGKRWAYTTS